MAIRLRLFATIIAASMLAGSVAAEEQTLKFRVVMTEVGGSIMDIAAALYLKIIRHDPRNPQWDDRDRVFWSAGHKAPALYVALTMGEKEDGKKWSLGQFLSYSVPYVLLSLVICYILMALIWVLPFMK